MICASLRSGGLPLVAALALCAGFQTAFAGSGDGQSAGAAPQPDKSRYTLFNPVPEKLMREFDSDRPDQTDGPHTVDAGHVQLEMDFANYTIDKHNAERDSTQIDQWNVAPVTLRIGVVNNAELDLIYDGYFNLRTKDRQTGKASTQSGFGDLTVRSKINLWGNEGGATAFGLIPALRIPTSTADLENHSIEGGLTFSFSAKLPFDFDLTASSGFEFIRNSTDAYYVADFQNGISISHGLGVKGLSAFVEFYSDVDTESPSPVFGQVDTGLIYKLGENVQLDVDCNFGVTREAPDFVPFAGLAVRF